MLSDTTSSVLFDHKCPHLSLHFCPNVSFSATLAIQYALLPADGSAPIACPFHGAYHFRYNRDSNRMCTSSTSYVRRCANDSKLRLTFGRCNNIEATDDEGIYRLQCTLWIGGASSETVASVV